MTNTQYKLSLAPFQGITDMAYRKAFMRHFLGIDKLYTPFFTGIQKENSKNLRNEEIDPHHNNVKLLVPQILSHDADEIVRFGHQCKEMGYNEINLNLGCPFPRVANKKRGCGILPYPELISEMLENVFTNIDIPLGIKCRFGYFSRDEIIPLINIFNRFPLSELIIHARIGKQLYSGIADLDFFAEIAPQFQVPVTYNGDIFTVTDFQRCQDTLPDIHSFMIGRGILTNPFLAEAIKGLKKPAEQQQRLYAFMNDLYNFRLQQSGGNPRVLGRMKELWSYTMNLFDEPQNVWRKIKKLNTLQDYEEAVESIFTQHKIILEINSHENNN